MKYFWNWNYTSKIKDLAVSSYSTIRMTVCNMKRNTFYSISLEMGKKMMSILCERFLQ